MPERISPSSSDHAEMDAHMYMLNLLLNPQMFFDQGYLETIPDDEREVLIGILKDHMQDVIDE